MKTISSIPQVAAAMSKGRRFRFESTTSLISVKKPTDACVGLAVVASKKAVHKKAVYRNKAKRRVRAAVRSALQAHFQYEIPHINWVIICQKSILTVSWQHLLVELSHALEKWGQLGGQNTTQ